MFGFGVPELALVGATLTLLVFALRLGFRTRWVYVDERWVLAVDQDRLEPPVVRMLSNLPGAGLQAGAPGAWTLSVNRAPGWTFVAVVLLFPLGLLFLLFREHAYAQLLLRPAPGGTEVLLVGRTQASVRETIARALDEVPVAAGAGRPS